MKRLFLLFILATFGVVHAPSILVANGVEQIESPAFNAVETIEQVETIEEAEPEVAQVALAAPSAGVNYSEPVVTVPSDNIAIAGRYVALTQSGSTEYVSDYNANRYGERFIYGHNSGAVFGVLYGAYAGQTFSVTVGGVTRNYMVADVVVYEKNQANGLLQINGQGNYMNSVVNATKKTVDEVTGQVSLTYYNLALMTCYGTMLGGGDATHRLVVFAYEI